MSKILQKILVILLLSIIFISNISNIIHAAYEITEAYIVQIGEAPYHLKYYNESKGMYTYSTCSIVGHYEGSKFYPAYCLNRDLQGVGAVASYTVDVDSLIDNNQVWRAVKNGYPYKSAQEMGLSSDFNAFAVTKFAIYCLTGQADINLYIADEGDEEGQAMLRALHNLVDIGRNGTQTPANTNITVEKVNGFFEDGNYYSQEYRINAPVETSQYTITATELPEGSKITDLSGNDKTTFSGNENFKIQIPKDKLTSNINVSIDVKGKSKVYPLFYGATRINGTQDYLLTYDVYGDTTGKTTMNVVTNTGKIQVIKTDDETFDPIANVTFGLYKKDGTEVARATTNSDGIATFQGLYQNYYVLKELSTNENYILSNVEFDVNVEYNKTTQIEVENEHKKGNLKVYKVDKDNNKISLGNVEFDLYSEEFDKVIGTYYTDVNRRNLYRGIKNWELFTN